MEVLMDLLTFFATNVKKGKPFSMRPYRNKVQNDFQ